MDIPYAFYAGIGSRKAPEEVLNIMTTLANSLAREGWVLRSGGADGADKAFERGANMSGKYVPEIYLPWQRYNNHPSDLFEIPNAAFDMASLFHPKGEWLKQRLHIHQLMARNCLQVLGQNLDLPVKMIICWTPDGCEDGNNTTKYTGGTGQALRVAAANNIPIFNLKHDTTLDRIVDFVDSLEN